MEDEPKTESSPKRTRAQIDEEYTKCATLLGDKEFKIKFLMSEVTLLLEKMGQLNLEAVQGPPVEEDKVNAKVE